MQRSGNNIIHPSGLLASRVRSGHAFQSIIIIIGWLVCRSASIKPVASLEGMTSLVGAVVVSASPSSEALPPAGCWSDVTRAPIKSPHRKTHPLGVCRAGEGNPLMIWSVVLSRVGLYAKIATSGPSLHAQGQGMLDESNCNKIPFKLSGQLFFS